MEEKSIAVIQDFNRVYASLSGMLDQHIISSKYAVPEVRILFELYTHQSLTASEIINLVQMDKGYVSRILKQFEAKKLIKKKASTNDGRAFHVSLTKSGNSAFEKLNQASTKQITGILEKLSPAEISKLTGSMTAIKKLLAKATS